LLIICGIAVIDIIASNLPKVANPGELIFSSIKLCVGGHACNVTLDLVQIGVPKNKIVPVFAVGSDILGDFLEKNIKNTDLKPKVFRTDKALTSKDLILVVKGEDRRFHVDPGANMYLSPEYVVEVAKKEKPTIFYLGGVGMLDALDKDLENVLRKIKDLGALTFVDVVAPYGKSWNFIISALKWVDIFHCNDVEIKEITGKDNLIDALEKISKLGVKFCIVTLGEKGLIANFPKVRITMPAFKVRVIDPTGAGDAFCAGLILKLFKVIRSKADIYTIKIEDWKNFLLYASACGAACCEAIGTTASVKPEYIKRIIRSQGGDVSRKTVIEDI